MPNDFAATWITLSAAWKCLAFGGYYGLGYGQMLGSVQKLKADFAPLGGTLEISLPQPYETFMSSLPASPFSRIFLSSSS